MPIEFDIKLTSKDMYRFNLYQTYTGFQGWFSIVFSIVILALSVITYGDVTLNYTIMYACIGIILLIYMPVSLWLRSKRSLSVSEVLRGTLHYEIGEEGFKVSQGEASAELPWEQIYRMVATKNNILVYSTRINAYVIPREQLGEKYDGLEKIANAKLPKYRVKMKETQQRG